jgi:hypothetical protein
MTFRIFLSLCLSVFICVLIFSRLQGRQRIPTHIILNLCLSVFICVLIFFDQPLIDNSVRRPK